MTSSPQAGSPLRLALLCQENAEHIRRMAKRIARLADGENQQTGALAKALDTLTQAMAELHDSLPLGPDATMVSRLLATAYLSQWASAANELTEDRLVAMRGNSSSLPISGVVEFLGSQRKSGRMTVTTNQEVFVLEFENGDVMYAASNNTPAGQRLGEILVEHGDVDPKILERVLARSAPGTHNLGDTLTTEQVICKEALHRALRAQTENLFKRLFSVEGAEFEFVELLDTGPMERVRLGVVELLLNTARANDEANLAESKS
jgi:hypothetical protein